MLAHFETISSNLVSNSSNQKTVLIPEENARDLKEIPDNIKADLTIKTVKWIDEVLAIALAQQPTPLADDVVATSQPLKSEEALEERVNTH